MIKKIVIANWKMHKTKQEALDYFTQLDACMFRYPNVRVAIAAPAIWLDVLQTQKPGSVEIFAQSIHEEENGAHTGDISVNMLNNLGISGSLAGHSERRAREMVVPYGRQSLQLLQSHKTAVLCVGETGMQRKHGDFFDAVQDQLDSVFLALEASGASNIILKNMIFAYEPIWAIGTGESASPAQIAEMHTFISDHLVKKIQNEEILIPLLYGGSVSSKNIDEIFAIAHVDGVLVGSASLEIHEMEKIIASAEAAYNR